jgi:hypothetical protein
LWQSNKYKGIEQDEDVEAGPSKTAQEEEVQIEES